MGTVKNPLYKRNGVKNHSIEADLLNIWSWIILSIFKYFLEPIGLPTTIIFKFYLHLKISVSLYVLLTAGLKELQNL